MSRLCNGLAGMHMADLEYWLPGCAANIFWQELNIDLYLDCHHWSPDLAWK